MKVFGGLINCVRTFGNQVISGIKTFSNKIYFSSPSSGEVEFIRYYQNNTEVARESTSLSGTTRVIFKDCLGTNSYGRLRNTSENDNHRLSFGGNGTNLNLTLLPVNSTDTKVVLFGSLYTTAINKFCLYPDYANAVDLSKANGTVADNGYILATIIGTTFTINGETITLSGAYNIYTQIPLLLPVKAGDTFSASNWGGVVIFKFIPNRW